jgi:transposase-like protein
VQRLEMAHRAREGTHISADVATCELCGWQDASHRRNPNRCPRCLRIKRMFLAGMSRREIGRELGISGVALSLTIHRLGIERPRPKVESCQLCGWHGLSTLFKARVPPCARNLKIKRMYLAGMSLPAVGRELGMDPSLVLRVLQVLGVKRRPPGGRHNPLGLNGRLPRILESPSP